MCFESVSEEKIVFLFLNPSNANITSFNNLFECESLKDPRCEGSELIFFEKTVIINTISILDFNHNIDIFKMDPFFNRAIVLISHPLRCHTSIRLFDIFFYTTTMYRNRAFLVNVFNKVSFSFLNSFLFSVISILNLSNGVSFRLSHINLWRTSVIYPPDLTISLISTLVKC